MRALRRHNLERTFAHQFLVIATPHVPPAPRRRTKRRGSGGVGMPWRPVRLLPSRRLALAAVKQAERDERRREAVAAWLDRRRITRPENRPAENRLMPGPMRRDGPMSLSELYQWHKRNGTLAVFFSMFPEL